MDELSLELRRQFVHNHSLYVGNELRFCNDFPGLPPQPMRWFYVETYLTNVAEFGGKPDDPADVLTQAIESWLYKQELRGDWRG